jgi:hypothetical protein
MPFPASLALSPPAGAVSSRCRHAAMKIKKT